MCGLQELVGAKAQGMAAYLKELGEPVRSQLQDELCQDAKAQGEANNKVAELEALNGKLEVEVAQLRAFKLDVESKDSVPQDEAQTSTEEVEAQLAKRKEARLQERKRP